MKILVTFVVLVLVAGCATKKSAETSASASAAAGATAKIEAKSGSSTEGTAEFVKNADGQITLTLKVRNLPAGKHAAHLHEKGDCSAADGSSAGSHWNPTTEAHGQWGHGAHHLGDIGNIEVAENGTGEITLTTDKWSIGTGATNDIVGKAVIVHTTEDDFKTQPTGNAGGRIGCGVVAVK